MRKLIFFLLIAMSVTACHKQVQVTGVTTEAIPVNASADGIQDLNYLARLAPTKEALDKEMSVQIGYAPQALWVGSPECPMLNWATDALWEAAKKVYPGKVDIAIVNMGGMRREWPKGVVTVGMVFELMPFDNELVVLTMKGSDIWELCESFAQYGAQGVAGMRVKIRDGQVKEVTVGGKPLKKEQRYTVATSDYLSGGTDHMTALTHRVDLWRSELRIRDLYLEAVQTQDTIRGRMDGRMDIQP